MIFILGGHGFVGSAYARLFLRENVPFEAITRETYAKFVGSTCDILINANGNSRKFLASESPLADFAASVTSVRSSLIDFKFKKYVFLSTSDVYANCTSPAHTREDAVIHPDHLSPYGFHKFLAELCVQHRAAEWLVIRQGGFVGPGLKKNAVFDVLHGDKLWAHPESRYQFISTDDSARLVMQLLESGIRNETLNLTSNGTISIAELMRLAARELKYYGDEKPLHYEISTEKVGQLLALPGTRSTIESFLHDYL